MQFFQVLSATKTCPTYKPGFLLVYLISHDSSSFNVSIEVLVKNIELLRMTGVGENGLAQRASVNCFQRVSRFRSQVMSRSEKKTDQ